jgi:sulfide:quinone oxidoreductase
VSTPVVCVVGAGTGGLEGLLAAREALGPAADLRLIAPEREFRYRPMSPDSLFRPAPERGVAIADLAAHAGATWVVDAAESVHEEPERFVLTRDGDAVGFDYLLIATGAGSERALQQGFVWQRGGDPTFLDRIIHEIVTGEIGRVAVAVPRGARWPLPAYELALVLAWSAIGTDVKVTLATAEQQPLAALGREATDAVSRELDTAGVEIVSAVAIVDEPEPQLADATARVILCPDEPDAADDAMTGRPADPRAVRARDGVLRVFDRLISLPIVVGPYVAGVATDAGGFVEVDSTLKVCGSDRVWAAGRCVAAGLEHSALSARQADAAIAAIAAAAGVDPGPSGLASETPDLTGLILTGQRDRWRAENPLGQREPSTRCLWWPPGRAVGRMLARQIAAWDPTVAPTLPSQPSGVAIAAPVALGCTDSGSGAGRAEATHDLRIARMRDVENRQLMAVRRRERAARDNLRSLTTELNDLAEHQQRVIRELRQRGYLRDYHPARPQR